MENPITSEEAAQLLNVTSNHIRLLCKRGELVGEKRGHDWWIERASVEAYGETPRKRGPKSKAKAGDGRP